MLKKIKIKKIPQKVLFMKIPQVFDKKVPKRDFMKISQAFSKKVPRRDFVEIS